MRVHFKMSAPDDQDDRMRGRVWGESKAGRHEWQMKHGWEMTGGCEEGQLEPARSRPGTEAPSVEWRGNSCKNTCKLLQVRTARVGMTNQAIPSRW